MKAPLIKELNENEVSINKVRRTVEKGIKQVAEQTFRPDKQPATLAWLTPEILKFIEKEKSLKQKITKKEKECENIIHEIMLLILETNMAILKNTQDPSIIDQEVFDNSEKLKNRFAEITKDIQELTKEYSIIMDVSNEFNREMHEKNSKN